MHLKHPMYVKYNDTVASGVQNVSTVHSHCPEFERDMHLKHPMYLKYNDIVASGVQNVSVVHYRCPDCERGMV